MPLYEFTCGGCGAAHELLLPMGAPAPPCPDCGGDLRKRFSRVAVRYEGWGFRSTDALVRDSRGKDFASLRERAERIADGD